MAWNDILGQELAKRILQLHLAIGRVAGGYLLSGPDGIGKRRLALEMTKALNCTSTESRPCDACRTCGQINRRVHPDVHCLLPGGASDQIKIEEVRQLVGRLALRPFNAAMQVAIIDGAERLTEEAANALLKTLEEPSTHTRFLLTTARLSRCLPTIVSRCQLIRCAPLPQQVIERILVEQQACDAQRAAVIASVAGGSASAALTLAERWESRQQIVDRLASDEPDAWLAQPLPETAEGVRELLDGMSVWLRDVAVASAADVSRVVHAEYGEVFERQADRIEPARCFDLVIELAALRDSLDQFVSPRLVASLARERWLSLIEQRSEVGDQRSEMQSQR